MQPNARARHADQPYHHAALACLVLSLLMTTAAASSEGPPVGITSITYGDVVYQSTQTVKVWRGLEAKLRVVGVPIGTSIDVVALLPDGQTPAPLIKVSRGNVDPTTAFVTLDAAPIAQLGEYLVRFVYAAAAGQPDQFRIRLYDRGTVNGLVVTPEWQKVAEDMNVTVTGQGLEHAKLDVSMLSSLALTNYSVVSRSATQFVFTVRPGQPGNVSISSHMFFDENVGATQTGLPASYLGNVNTWLDVLPNPIITGLTPQVVADGGEVTLKGANFVAEGWTASVRQNMLTSNWSVPATVVNSTTLRFNAKPNMTAQDLAVRYTPASGSGNVQVGIPQTIWVNTPPIITDAGTSLWGTAPPACNAPPCSTSGDTRVFGVRSGETHSIHGFYLASAPGTTVTARLGNTPLNIVSAISGHIRFTVPELADVVGTHIFVETSGGTGTSPRAANYNPAPSNLGLLRKDGLETSSTAPMVPVTDGKLERNRNYRITGSNLEFMVDGFPATDAVVRPKLMQGSAQFLPLSFIAGNISFFVPTDQPLGSYTLSYGHWGGTASLGTFQVVENKPLAVVGRLAVTSSSVWYDNGSVQGTTTSRTIQSGTSRTAYIAVREFSQNGELQPLLVTSTDPAIVPGTPSVWTPASLSGGENGALNVAPYPNPTASVSLQVQAVPEDRNAVLRFSVGPAPNANGIAEVPVVIRAVQPPATRQLTVDQTAVHGGQSLKGTLLLEFTPVFPVTVPLASSDPVAAQVPASVTMSRSSIIVPVTTSDVPKVTSVAITAGTGRTAQSATFAVHPAPVLQSFTAATTPLEVGQPVDLTISLAAPATRATEVRLTSSNPVALPVPMAVTFAEGQQAATVRVVPGLVFAETSVSVQAKVGESLRVLQVRVVP